MVKLFSREFQHLEASFLQDLQTLEEEGAIHAQLGGYCRIQLTPAEIVNYVEACVAYDEFEGLYERYGDPRFALEQLTNARMRNRVREYNEWTVSIGQNDTMFCFAAFLGEHLESLFCGGCQSVTNSWPRLTQEIVVSS